jgi:hypothetical protein
MTTISDAALEAETRAIASDIVSLAKSFHAGRGQAHPVTSIAAVSLSVMSAILAALNEQEARAMAAVVTTALQRQIDEIAS